MKNPALILVVAAALVDAEGRILLADRPEGRALAGLWEFPGGKVETGETPEQALCRELDEELKLTVQPQDLSPYAFASHALDGGKHLLMPLFVCRRWTGTPVPQEGQKITWTRPEALSSFALPPADLPLVAMIQQRGL